MIDYVQDDETFENFDFASTLNTNKGELTVYAVICIHAREDGLRSHGGFCTGGPADAMKLANECNSRLGNGKCDYVPVPLAVPLETLEDMQSQLRTGHVPNPEDNDD